MPARNAKPRIIFNDDSVSINVVQPPFTNERIALAVEHLAGSQVDCLCWKVFRRFTAGWPSRVCEAEHEMYWGAQTDPNHVAGHLRYDLHRQGVDYLPVLIEATRQRGIAFFPSFRMNDCHHRSRPSEAAEFWKTHQHYRLWEVQDGRNYYNAALDYSYEEVRDRMFAAIHEFVHRYDVDGVELDFCRNPYIFQPSEGWGKRDILTQFIGRLQAMARDVGAARGGELTLLVRVPFSDRLRTEAGMDVERWINDGLMDVLVMSSLKNDCDLAIEPWRSMCREAGVLFYPSLEAGPLDNAPAHNHVVRETPDETVTRQRAAARNMLMQDPDGIYMFNYPCLLFGRGVDQDGFRKLNGVLSQVGSIETLEGLARQYVFWKNLPIIVESGRPPQYHQTIAFEIRDETIDRPENRVCLSFRQVAEANPHAKGRPGNDTIIGTRWMKYLLNGHEIDAGCIDSTIEPAGAIQSGFTLGEHELVTIRPPASALRDGENRLAFHVPRFPKEHDPCVFIHELIVDVE